MSASLHPFRVLSSPPLEDLEMDAWFGYVESKVRILIGAVDELNPLEGSPLVILHPFPDAFKDKGHSKYPVCFHFYMGLRMDKDAIARQAAAAAAAADGSKPELDISSAVSKFILVVNSKLATKTGQSGSRLLPHPSRSSARCPPIFSHATCHRAVSLILSVLHCRQHVRGGRTHRCLAAA